MQRLGLLLLLVVAGGCHPRMSVGYDATAHTRGPLANLQVIPRVTAVAAIPAPAPPEGRNYSFGVAFGDKNFTIGARIHANNISGSTLDPLYGPQYMSGAAALDLRWHAIRFKGASLVALLAPSYTMLVDSTAGTASHGNGIRAGGGVEFALSAFRVYADVYEERMLFMDGPATGHSTRNGITIGLAFQP